MQRISSAKFADKVKSSGLAWMSIVLGGGGVLGFSSLAHADYTFNTSWSFEGGDWNSSQWTGNGNGYDFCNDGGVSPAHRLRLTSSNSNQNGSEWLNTAQLYGAQDWTVYTRLQYTYYNGSTSGSNNDAGGDGMSIVLQTNGTGAMQNGAHFDENYQSTNLGNYVAITLDTYKGSGDNGNNDLQVTTSNGGLLCDIALPTSGINNGSAGFFHNSDYINCTAAYTASSGNLNVAFGYNNGNTLFSYNIPVNLSTTFGSAKTTVGWTAATGAGYENADVLDAQIIGTAAPSQPAYYNLTAAVSGGALAHGRLTQGQTCTTTAYINNSGGYLSDNLNYGGLSMWGTQGIADSDTGGNLPYGYWGNSTGTFTATTVGPNTFFSHLDGSTTNASLGGNANFAGGNITATIQVDALVEHVNATGMTDTGNATTTPTAFYRQNASWGGANLGSVTVAKQGPGSYTPAFVTGINTAAGTLTITASGADNQFGSDTSIALLGFQNVNHLGGGSGTLSAIEAALTTYGVEWRDYTGASNNWPTLTSGLDPLASINQIPGAPDFDLELAFNDGTLTSNTSYFDFNFSGQLGTAGNVVSIAVVPEPATLSLLALSSIGLLGKRSRRLARK